MFDDAFVKAFTLLFVLLNPFLMTIYLLSLIRSLSAAELFKVLIRASLISGFFFSLLAWSGDAIFTDVLHVRYASFLLFGGLIFLVVGIRFVMVGPTAVEQLLGGTPHRIAGSIALPFMIGPATVNASIYAGATLNIGMAALAIAFALGGTVVGVLLLKLLHDYVHIRHNQIVERYVDIVGRISALIIGTIAIEMILRGIDLYLAGRA